jgi:UDP:flavonoid glycosyltransferase YjiC (YdhE family)
VAGAAIPRHLPNLAEELADARLIVHLGSGNTAASALAAGVPQLVLAVDIEKELNGRALEGAGVAKLLRAYDPDVRLSTELIIAMAEDDALAAHAAEIAKPHRQMLSIDPLGLFMRDCFDLLGIAAPVR